MDCSANTLQFSALIEEYIYEKPEGSRRFYSITNNDLQKIAEKVPEYLLGEDTFIEGDRIYLRDFNDELEQVNIGIIQFFRDEPRPTFVGINQEELKKEKDDQHLEFFIIVARNNAGILFIKEIDDSCNHMELDIS